MCKSPYVTIRFSDGGARVDDGVSDLNIEGEADQFDVLKLIAGREVHTVKRPASFLHSTVSNSNFRIGRALKSNFSCAITLPTFDATVPHTGLFPPPCPAAKRTRPTGIWNPWAKSPCLGNGGVPVRLVYLSRGGIHD